MKARLADVRFAGILALVACALPVIAVLQHGQATTAREPPSDDLAQKYDRIVRPVVQKYCLICHSTKLKKGSLDLERFASLEQVRKDLKPWQQAIEMLEAAEMPPKSKPQPSADERRQVIGWIRTFMDAEARARAGDPGHVPLRRLSNAEYDATIRDLTGVDLRPTREFPADGAAGEGFTNAAEALSDISPTLLGKYLNAAKEISAHAVLLPDGFRFSPTKTRRDWTNESTARLRAFYAEFTPDGRLHVEPYLRATVRHRPSLLAGKTTLDEVARKEKLNPKYLNILWHTLTDNTPSFPLDPIRARWRRSSEKDVAALAAAISAWQTALWRFVPIGSYRYGNVVRQVANDPVSAAAQPLRLAVKPAPGQSEVVLHLVSQEIVPGGKDAHVIWQRPRFERAGKPPLLLRDYAVYGPAYEVDLATLFADTSRYLAAVAEAAHDHTRSAEQIARRHGLRVDLLKRWIDVVALDLNAGATNPEKLGRRVQAVALDLLGEKVPKNDQRPGINGWRRKGVELPLLLANSSNTTEHVPGTMPPHVIAVHPTPTEFVAVSWKSPLAGRVRVTLRVAHAHPACGNGVAWWLEHRRGDRAFVLADGALELGGKVQMPDKILDLKKGDRLILAIDAKNGDHSCDLTEIALSVSETDKPGRRWDLSADVADSVLLGNPHADKHGNKNVWSFIKGPSRPMGKNIGPVIPPGSLLARWRDAAADPRRSAEAATLALRVQTLLTGARPGKVKDPDRILYDNLVSVESFLLSGLDLTRLGKSRPRAVHYGLARERFGNHPSGKPAEQASLVVAANTVTEVRLPAALFQDREFVVEGKLDSPRENRVVRFAVQTAPSGPDAPWDGKSPVVASRAGPAYRQLLGGLADFRRCFPMFLCFPAVIPTDEVVCLKMYHREDEPLARLLLDEEQKRHIDRLWEEHRFISQQPLAEYKYLPLFIGFVTQDQPKELLAYFEGQRGVFRKRAEDFERDVQAAIPSQMAALLEFAGKAYRRPLTEKQKTELLGLYRTLRDKNTSHDEAFRGVLARVLVSPGFLFRIEQAPPGKKPGRVDDWELACRLSYFLTSSLPDDELRRLAAAGKLHEANVLVEQTRRLLRDGRLRSLAIEFGTQWIHVRGFDELREKNEKLFPMFDAELRKAIYEESILFFQDLFESDRSVSQLLDADYTFLNELLARHYCIPGVSGPQWRRVEGVRKYGRGGILGLASVQTKQSGASRTSPVLRGNWVVETLLGEKLPRPPANVPKLPEEESGADRLTLRQQVERHTREPACAVCHVRIDPLGFALEKYDAIGRLREKDLGGLAVDAHAKLKDGSEFDGIDGLRGYLLTKKKDVIVRLFCQKLLGYALGRTVTLSDQSVIDEMVAELNKNKGRISAAVLAIVRSPQFRMIRGSEFVE